MNIFQSSAGLSDNATETRRLATERLQLILYEVCPNQCSGHGQCGNSVCTCDEGTHCTEMNIGKTTLDFVHNHIKSYNL